MPKLEMPSMERLPKLEMPKLELPMLEMPTLDMPTLDMPKMDKLFVSEDSTAATNTATTNTASTIGARSDVDRLTSDAIGNIDVGPARDLFVSTTSKALLFMVSFYICYALCWVRYSVLFCDPSFCTYVFSPPSPS